MTSTRGASWDLVPTALAHLSTPTAADGMPSSAQIHLSACGSGREMTIMCLAMSRAMNTQSTQTSGVHLLRIFPIPVVKLDPILMHTISLSISLSVGLLFAPSDYFEILIVE